MEFTTMIDSHNFLETIDLELGLVNYSIGLHPNPKGGVRGTWMCQHCALMGATTKPRISKTEAVELVKAEVLNHHHEHHCPSNGKTTA